MIPLLRVFEIKIKKTKSERRELILVVGYGILECEADIFVDKVINFSVKRNSQGKYDIPHIM